MKLIIKVLTKYNTIYEFKPINELLFCELF